MSFLHYILLTIFTRMVNGFIIETDSGPVRGRLVRDNHAAFYSYRGIPYAESPTGRLRFMPPLLKTPWLKIMDATKFGPACPQKNSSDLARHEMDEDCLNLNVYVPFRESRSPRAVLVFAHSGEFNARSGRDDVIAPQFYINHDVIMVTFNYRLGALGFLSVQTEDAAGNAGLKDSLLVLKWVKRNIAHFGGDPHNVTFGGESAGAAIVHYLLMSKESKNLFQKVIMISGSALSYRFLNRHPVETAFWFAERLGYHIDDRSELIQALRKVDAFDIVGAQDNPNNIRNGFRPFAPFVPVVEAKSSHAIITTDPTQILEAGTPQRVPVLTGFSSAEGIKMLPAILNNFNLAENLNENFELCIPSDIEYPYGSTESKELARSIKEFYFDDKDISNSTLQNFVDMVTDTQFAYSTDSWIKLYEGTNNTSHSVFYYIWNFDGELNWFKILRNVTFKGAAHMDHAGYMYPTAVTKPLLRTAGKQSRLMINIFLELWTNFMKTGKPTPMKTKSDTIWSKSGTMRNHLLLNDQPTMTYSPPSRYRHDFWYRVYHQYSTYVNSGGKLEAKILP